MYLQQPTSCVMYFNNQLAVWCTYLLGVNKIVIKSIKIKLFRRVNNCLDVYLLLMEYTDEIIV